MQAFDKLDANGVIHDPPLARNFSSELLVIDRGRGVWLWDIKGNKYLDLGSGIAVNSFGYGRGDLARLVGRQLRRLPHTSNLYTSVPTVRLAERMVESANAGAGRTADDARRFAAVQFGNSGSEANEAALKYARLYSRRLRGEAKFGLLSFSNAFHGRTLGALSVTPTPAYREPFEPLLPGTASLPFNDAAALEKKLDSSFAGVIVEVVQGEGGLMPMSEEFARTLNRLCRQHDIILIADEVQTGLGRTGTLFASWAAGLDPDIVTLAKPLAGGLPLAATIIPEKINRALKPGDHGTTFGGGPVTTALAGRIWDSVSSESFLAAVRAKGDYLEGRLDGLAGRFRDGPLRLDPALRGRGLLRGLAVTAPEDPDIMKKILAEAQNRGVLVLRSGKNVIRLAPPLVIKKNELDEGLHRLETALAAVRQSLSRQA